MDPAEIEAANRLRKTLGLALLPTSTTLAPAQASNSVAFKENSSSSDDEPGSTLETRENAGYQNWQDLQDEAAAKKKREQKALAIKKARDAAQKFTRLEGKGLGDLGGEEDLDAKAWLKKSKSRQKKIEAERRRRLEEEASKERRLAAVEYGAEDLAGIKVAHEARAFEEIDGEQILTLKDAAVDEEDEAELENVDLRESEKLKEKAELKKKKAYDPLSNEEIPGERNLLSQYDEKKRKAFTLGSAAEERDTKRQAVGGMLRALPISLGAPKETPLSDYLDTPVKIKKPKKKPTNTRQKKDEKDIFPASYQPDTGNKDADLMEFDRPQTAVSKTKDFGRSSLVDDDELSNSLSLNRRLAIKKRKLKPDDLARAIQKEKSATPDELEEPARIVIDQSREWLGNLKIEPQTAKPKRDVSNPKPRGGDGAAIMEGSDDEERTLAQPQTEQLATLPQVSATGLEEEPTLDGPALGGALQLLRPRGLLQSSELDPNRYDRQNESFLQKKRRLEIESENRIRLERLHQRESGGGSRLSAAEKQELAMHRNQAQSYADSRDLARLFENEYRPDVNISHTADDGRVLTVKEAFKHLSHKFHGKGSGAGKTSKLLKKVAEEKKREASTLLDTSQATGMNNAMGTTAKRNKQAGVRLG